MGTAYQPPVLASFDDHHAAQYISDGTDRRRNILCEAQAALNRSSSLAAANGTRPVLADNSNNNWPSSYQHHHQPTTSQGRNTYDYLENSHPMQHIGTLPGLTPAPSYLGTMQAQAPTPPKLPPPSMVSISMPAVGPAAAAPPPPPPSSAEARSAASTAAAAEVEAVLYGPPADQVALSKYSARPSTPAADARYALSVMRPEVDDFIRDADQSGLVLHSLDIPRCISSKGGSLPDFTAELTCLFWFESPISYQFADNIDQIPLDVSVPRLSELAIPTTNFRLWVGRILSTTQVTQNVILLALLFIYRLKSLNPMVLGKLGSEFRLLTVALMLANKYLDDNTYTNKTWSDVSMLHVKEIHVMEVEFLSNMRYGLFVSRAEWDLWMTKLAKFRIFYERASMATGPSHPPPRIPLMLSPQRPYETPALSPSRQLPNGSGSFGHSASPAFPSSISASSPLQITPSMYRLSSTQSAQNGLSAMDPMPDLRPVRAKRTAPYEDAAEPPSKRSASRQHVPLPPSAVSLPPIIPQSVSLPAATLQQPTYTQPPPPGSALLSSTAPEARRLPAPSQLSLGPLLAYQPLTPAQVAQQTQQQIQQIQHIQQIQQQQKQQIQQLQQIQQMQQIQQIQQQQTPMSLPPPPLVPGLRAMATVYPTSSSTGGLSAGPLPALATGPGSSSSGGGGGGGYASHAPHALPLLTTTGLGLTGGTPSSGLTTGGGGGGTTPTSLNPMTPSVSSVYAAAAAAALSPMTESFPQHVAGSGGGGGAAGVNGGGGHTPMSHSPSIYLQQRTSPYRPIRNVHMLLNPPPPSSSLQDYQTASGPILVPPPPPPTQMYYQPLGRRHDLRPGILPEFQGMTFGGGGGRSGGSAGGANGGAHSGGAVRHAGMALTSLLQHHQQQQAQQAQQQMQQQFQHQAVQQIAFPPPPMHHPSQAQQ